MLNKPDYWKIDPFSKLEIMKMNISTTIAGKNQQQWPKNLYIEMDMFPHATFAVQAFLAEPELSVGRHNGLLNSFSW